MRFDFHYGKVGSGKTLLAMYKLLRDYLEGRRILGNIHVFLPNSVYVEPIDIISSLDPKDTSQFSGRIAPLLNDNSIPKTVLLDEIGKWWDSRTSGSQLNRFLAYFVDQCRKRNINLIVTDQHISGLDLRGRQSTDSLTRCICQYYPQWVKGVDGRPVPYKFFYIQLDTEFSDIKPPKAFTWKAEDVSFLYQFYKTEEIVVPAELMLMRGER